jgi:hypothetical protein
MLMPMINGLSTSLTAFNYTNQNLQMGNDMYPGQDWCKKTSPHAIWHHQTAIALVDFVYLADEMNRIFISSRSRG